MPPPALGYMLSPIASSRALTSLERMLRLLIFIPVVNGPRHLLALLRQQHLVQRYGSLAPPR